MPASVVDMTQNPHLQAPMSFRSAPMQYLLSKMPQSDQNIIGQSAEAMGDFARDSPGDVRCDHRDAILSSPLDGRTIVLFIVRPWATLFEERGLRNLTS